MKYDILENWPALKRFVGSLIIDLEINSRQKAMKTAYSTYQLRYSLSTEAACHDLLVTEKVSEYKFRDTAYVVKGWDRRFMNIGLLKF